MWWLSLLGALAATLTGALGWSAAGDVLARIAPVLVFARLPTSAAAGSGDCG